MKMQFATQVFSEIVWDDLKEQVKYLLTCRLNQDCLENFLGLSEGPGLLQKVNVFETEHSGTENCKAYPDSVLLKLKDISSDRISPPFPPPFTNQCIDKDYQKYDMLQNCWIGFWLCVEKRSQNTQL